MWNRLESTWLWQSWLVAECELWKAVWQLRNELVQECREEWSNNSKGSWNYINMWANVEWQRKQRWVVKKRGKKRVGHVADAEGRFIYLFITFFSSILCSLVQRSLKLFIGQDGSCSCGCQECAFNCSCAGAQSNCCDTICVSAETK